MSCWTPFARVTVCDLRKSVSAPIAESAGIGKRTQSSCVSRRAGTHWISNVPSYLQDIGIDFPPISSRLRRSLQWRVSTQHSTYTASPAKCPEASFAGKGSSSDDAPAHLIESGIVTAFPVRHKPARDGTRVKKQRGRKNSLAEAERRDSMHGGEQPQPSNTCGSHSCFLLWLLTLKSYDDVTSEKKNGFFFRAVVVHTPPPSGGTGKEGQLLDNLGAARARDPSQPPRTTWGSPCPLGATH